MGEKYYFCNSRFKAQIQDGTIRSVSMMGDGDNIPYLNEEKGYGNLYLTWEKGEERKQWQPLGDQGFADGAPVVRGRSVRYEGGVQGEELKVTVRFRLGEVIEQEILVENVCSEPVRLLDFGLRLACHTKFTWGGDTGREVIGHHFISGHGSHSTLYRCDGKGSLLAVLPWGDSQWTHYEEEILEPIPGRDGTDGKGVVILYSLSGGIGAKRAEEGAKLRIAPVSVQLEPGECYRYRGRMLFAGDYEDCRSRLVEQGQVMAESIPGYTVPREQPVLLALRWKPEAVRRFGVEATQADGGNPEAAGRLTAGEGAEAISAEGRNSGAEAARTVSAEGRDSGAEAARMASAEGRSSGAEAAWTVSAEEGIRVEAEDAEVEALGINGAYHIFRIAFRQLGERTVRVDYGGKYMNIYYFVTQDVRTMLGKRAAFIAGKQIRDEEKWYNGLLAEYNNETGAVLSPDNYDKIGGWRIYEVTCDDPGLSKPAFLSSAQTVCPDQAQVDALDDYIQHFVWGGLQQRTDEPFPYGIYGIPDWHVLRESEDPGNRGRTHLWRVYDYPHIALMYYNMYQVAAFAENITTRLSAKEYLQRAYGTARALFTVPAELEGWSAYETGFYNELAIPEIIEALKREKMELEAQVLEGHWNRKMGYFVKECKDVFGSEYPFDTTGFESTHVLAARALETAEMRCRKLPYGEDMDYGRAVEFMENQTACNVACRGLLEPAYFWYGSDYRGDNLHYTLSYMTQMGGDSLLDYACYYAQEPFGMLRLAYGSLLGSWALLNCGDEESGYGYWFPGKEKDGCASGGFEPLYGGETWLNQPHHGGAWYYSCEIDLGFCGGLRGAATVVAEDPVFGRVCYGGSLEEAREGLRVTCRDGVGRRFHYIGAEGRIHAECDYGEWSLEDGVLLGEGFERIELKAVSGPWKREALRARVLMEGFGDYRLAGTDVILRDGEWCELPVPEGEMRFLLERV
ncbi:MAG: hypothetical protein HFH97_13605 [Lachnospiraceae bacterium]|nr:DUF5695 domain-containing protein [uncultured Acetatifactor sp.]MCI9573615.1 hypothetical protein [Lachnospiraceae bacterium]